LKSNRIKIKISKSLQGKILKGHPWVTYYQIKDQSAPGAMGDLGVIYDASNRFLAVGLYDPHSDIRLRILQTKEPADINAGFFRQRLQQALHLRKDLPGQGTTGYRILNGENDGFPGLVADRYDTTLAIKIYTAAWIPLLEDLKEVFAEVEGIERAVLLFSRHVDRTQESAYRHGQVLFGPELHDAICFKENGLWFEADILKGHKTGFYLDQRENRQKIRELSREGSVLNVFSYTGGFSTYAFAGGCRSVLEIDINDHAQEASRNHLRMNFGDQMLRDESFQQICGDAFKQLANLDREKKTFDLVILDPPAFATNKKNKPQAIQAYIRLARAGAKVTREGGTLFAASCSSQVSAQEFFRAVDLGIRQTRRPFEKLMRTRHPLDHPVTFAGGAYLKAIYCKIKG